MKYTNNTLSNFIKIGTSVGTDRNKSYEASEVQMFFRSYIIMDLHTGFGSLCFDPLPHKAAF